MRLDPGGEEGNGLHVIRPPVRLSALLVSPARPFIAALTLVLAAVALWSKPARADPLVQSTWTGAVYCGDGFNDAITEWIEASEIPENLVVEVDVDYGEDGLLEATVVLENEWGTTRRVLHAAGCQTLERSVGLLVAIASSAVAVATTPAVARALAPPPTAAPVIALPMPAPPPMPTVLPVEEPRVVAPVRRAPRFRGRRRGLLRVDALAGVGQVPRPSGGIGGALGLATSKWSVTATVQFWPKRSTLSNSHGERADIALVTAGAAGCYGVVRRSIAFAGCGLVEAGAMLGRGRNVAMARRRSLAYAALGIGPELRWQATPRLGLVVAVEGLALVHRPRFAVEGRGDLYVAPIAAVRSRIGIELRLP